MAAPVEKIYKLSTLGFDEIHKNLQAVAKDFTAIKKAKRDAETGLASAKSSQEATKYREELQKIKIAEAELRVTRQKMTNEAKAESIARQVAINQEKDRAKAVQATSGWYKNLTTEIKLLGAAIKGVEKQGDPVTFNGKTIGFDAAINKLKELTAAEQAFRRQFAADKTLVGEYTTGIVQAFKQMGLGDLIGGQITKASARIKDLDKDFENLKQELSNVGVTGKGNLDIIEKELIDNRKEALLLKQQVTGLQQSFRGVGDIGSLITGSIAKGFQAAKGQLTSFALQYLGLQAIISRAQSGVQEAKLSSDLTTDLEIQLSGSAKAADQLNKSLRGLDTRTTLIGLQQIADTALRAGATAENISEVTKAIDVAKVAFGKDFGSVEQGTETFAKLINIFFDDGEITGDRILKIGNSIRALANSTVASVPFITDFSGRMAGLRQIANVSLPDIIGLGAGFEEFKQSAEVASTALVKVIPKLAEDTQKFADILGVTKEQFSALLDTNPAEALIQVAEKLVQSGKGIEEVSAAMGDAELGAGRITTILATLGGKADIFRARIALAGTSMQETGAITDAFAKKNNNLAGTIDKTSKKITDAFASKNFQVLLAGIFSVISLIIGGLPVLLTLLGLLTISWAAQNTVLIIGRAQLILYNLAIGANLILLNALRIANLAYIAVMFLVNGVLSLVTKGLALFNITLKASSGPLGVILAIAGLLATAFAAFGRSITTSKDQLSEFIRLQKINSQINKEATNIIGDQISKLDGWVAVIKSAATSADTKKRAVEELIKIDKAFSGVIQDNVIDLKLLDDAYQQVISSIQAKARAEAAASLTAAKEQRIRDIAALRQDIEIQVEAKKTTTVDIELTDEQKKLLKESSLLNSGAIVAFTNDGAQIFSERFDQVKAFLDQKELEAVNVYKDYLKAQVQTQEDLTRIQGQVAAEQQATALAVSKGFEVDIAFLREQIKKLDEQIDKFQGSKAALAKLVADRKVLQEQLERLLGAEKKSAGSRSSKLTGEQKDDFKDIEAARDRLNAIDEKRRLQSEIDEETFLETIFATNVNAINQKLRLLSGANAEERKQKAQFDLEKIKLEQELNDKLFELRAKALKDQFDIDTKNAQEEAARVKQDPTASATAKAQAQLDADKLILAAQIKFNIEMDLLEKDRNNLSKKNAEDRARDARNAQANINEDQKKLLLAAVEDERLVGEKLMAEFENIINAQRQAILNSTKSPAKKDRALKKLEEEELKGRLAREAAALNSELIALKKALEAKAITEEDYAKRYDEYVKRLIALNDLLNKENSTTVQGLVTNKLSGLFGFKQGSEEAKLFAQTIQQTFDLAKTAMDDFYAAEQQQIQNSLDIQLKRLDIEKQQQLDRAQSKEEEASINAQFAAKQDAANRAAFEKNKKLQREQAKINLAIQLSNLAVIAFAPNPANIATLGIAGAIMYAIQAAIAIANYALNISRINSAKFARGGIVKERVPTKTGGKVTGPSHRKGGVKFIYEAEGEELAIVNKRSAKDTKVRTITGTNKQIASMINELGGGVKFAGGAKIKKFESGGFIGQSLQAPVFTPASTTVINNNGDKMISEKLDEVIESNRAVAKETAKRFDRLEVRQVTSTVTDAQRKAVKQSNIGTL